MVSSLGGDRARGVDTRQPGESTSACDDYSTKGDAPVPLLTASTRQHGACPTRDCCRASQFTHVIDVAPTIFEAAGLPEPTMVNGVQQSPMEGTSML